MSPLERIDWLAAIGADADARGALHVAAMLAHYLGRDGRAVVATPELASELGLAKRNVQRHIRHLESAGWLAVEISRGRGKANSYYPQMRRGVNGQKVSSGVTFLDEHRAAKR